MSGNFALQPGTVLAGKYRVEGVLGQGGMGVVAAVLHLQLQQRMALKLMLPQATANHDATSRFIREARAAARITSEHVARVFDVGTLDSGEPYIAMEYLEGSDIAQLLAARGRLPFDESIDYLLQACEALAEAHVAGIVHRDLKPGNLFLARRVDGQQLLKVLDFGVSKVTGAGFPTDAGMTQTSALMGSPLYMSPEQMTSSKGVDPRSDIWALGVVLYEMLAGARPFQGESLPQVCGMVMTEEPVSLAERTPGLPPPLYAAVARCLQKEPGSRFQSIAELAQALKPVASARGQQSIERISRVQGVSSSISAAAPPNGPTLVSAATSVPPPTVLDAPGTNATWGKTKPPMARKPNGAQAALLGVAGLIALGVGGAWLIGRASRAAPATEASAAAAPPVLSITPSAPALVTATEAVPVAAPITVDSATPPLASVTPARPPDAVKLVAPAPNTKITAAKSSKAVASVVPSATQAVAPSPVPATSQTAPLPVSTRSRL